MVGLCFAKKTSVTYTHGEIGNEETAHINQCSVTIPRPFYRAEVFGEVFFDVYMFEIQRWVGFTAQDFDEEFRVALFDNGVVISKRLYSIDRLSARYVRCWR